jgi:hypothetical protein
VGCHKIIQNPIDKVTHFLSEDDSAICIERDELYFGDWTPGRYAWELANVKILEKPTPAKGKQGLWNWERFTNDE